ncbi:MAG TPA: hypothetical protein DCM05_06590 [Elusimicrobia bacterium]|nr:hypothetical protein [Elusimicrobiota bacterium]
MRAYRKLSAVLLPYLLFAAAAILGLMRVVFDVLKLSAPQLFEALHRVFSGLGIACVAAVGFIVLLENRLRRREKAGEAAWPEEDEKWLLAYWLIAGIPLSLSLIFGLFLSGACMISLWDSQARMAKEITAIRQTLEK